jgi:hypothetical protein
MALNGRSKAALVHQLKLFVDTQGVIRCGGRFQNANLSYQQKYPILLPRKHEYTRLHVVEAHANILHSGIEATVSIIRQLYWVPQIRQVVRKCRSCLAVIGKTYTKPPTPALPKCRIQERAPFAVTGVDYTGTLYYSTATHKFNKAYVCLFTCAITRAIHLERT